MNYGEALPSIQVFLAVGILCLLFASGKELTLEKDSLLFVNITSKFQRVLDCPDYLSRSSAFLESAEIDTWIYAAVEGLFCQPSVAFKTAFV